jgi:hypothetical protein
MSYARGCADSLDSIYARQAMRSDDQLAFVVAAADANVPLAV